MTVRFHARMAPPSDQSRFGQRIVAAILVMAVPFAMAGVDRAPTPIVWVACLLVGGAILASALKLRGGSLHDVTLDGDRLTVTGPVVSLDVQGELSCRAQLGEVVAQAGARTVRMSVRVLHVLHADTVVLVLEEAVAASAASDDWPEASDADLDAASGAPRLQKSVVAPDLEKLRTALA